MQNKSAPESILDEMHRAILTADFSRLVALTPHLETALQDVEQMRDTRRINRIRSMAERNEACLLAAGRGVRSAQRRMTELRDAASGMITYDGKGQRADLGPRNSMTRRY